MRITRIPKSQDADPWDFLTATAPTLSSEVDRAREAQSDSRQWESALQPRDGLALSRAAREPPLFGSAAFSLVHIILKYGLHYMSSYIIVRRPPISGLRRAGGGGGGGAWATTGSALSAARRCGRFPHEELNLLGSCEAKSRISGGLPLYSKDLIVQE